MSNNVWQDVPTLNTWVVEILEHTYSLGTTYGAIFVSVDMYTQYPGDDFPTTAELMLDAANFQINKIRLSGIPGNP